MSLDISEKRVGLAYCHHPSSTNAVHQLEPVTYMSPTRPMKRFEANERAKKLVAQLVKEYRPCGFIVSWPLQPDGRAGQPCGKVLHLLDHFSVGKRSIISKNRPFTLWDARDLPQNNLEVALKNNREHQSDKWGRCQLFSRIPSPHATHYSSLERYCHEFTKDSTGAYLVLKDFMDSYFDTVKDEGEEEYHEENRIHDFSHAIEDGKSIVDLEEYATHGAYIQPYLL